MKRTFRIAVASVVAASGFATVNLVGPSAGADPVRPAPVVSDVQHRGEDAVRTMGDRIPQLAGRMGLSPDQLAHTIRADTTLSADDRGDLLVTEDAPSDALSAASAASWSTTPPWDTATTFTLTSKASATKTIYLDFTGHTMTGTLWNTAAKPSITLAPFDLDGNPQAFSTAEHALIQNAFLSVREDFSDFEVRVTTQDPGVEALRKTSSSDVNYGVRVVVTPTNFNACGCGGQAYISSFDAATDTPAYVLNTGQKSVAEAISHEAGHTLGLSHDGVTTGNTVCAADAKACAYYTGHGDWAPIMGVGYSKRITQWSKGEYANANNTQDDIAILRKTFPLSNDRGGSIAAATTLALGTTIYGEPVNFAGDVDAYKVSVPAARTLSVNVTNWYGDRVDTNLNARVKLLNSAGTLLATVSPTDTTSAKLTSPVTAGTYYVMVDGVGEGSPLNTGYSTYGSTGRYNMTIA